MEESVRSDDPRRAASPPASAGGVHACFLREELRERSRRILSDGRAGDGQALDFGAVSAFCRPQRLYSEVRSRCRRATLPELRIVRHRRLRPRVHAGGRSEPARLSELRGRGPRRRVGPRGPVAPPLLNRLADSVVRTVDRCERGEIRTANPPADPELGGVPRYRRATLPPEDFTVEIRVDRT